MNLAVPGTSYANMPMTLSVWARSSSPTTLTLVLTDSPQSAANGSNNCSVTTVWQRCVFTYTFPSGAEPGFSANLLSAAGSAAQTVSVWGPQVEQASTAGPFVSTIGSARPTGGQGGTVSFASSSLAPGNHSITAVYGGDTDFVTSTSNAVAVVVNKAAPTVTAITPSPVSPATYGQTVTFAVALAAPGGDPQVPSGTVSFYDGATLLGSPITVNGSGNATLSLSGPNLLSAGSHSITAVYSGDSNFTTITSSALSYVVSTASSTVSATSSLNPSIYGDSVTFTIQVSSVGAVPTGTVQVKDGGTILGTATLSSGNTIFTAPLLNAGAHTITFTYSGDSNHH